MKLPGLRLCIATSKLIRQWAQRQLPNGKILKNCILNPKTVNYQTLKPERDGLFCERIFGPVNDSLCACGRLPLRGQKFCPHCEVEYISTRVRRYRLGYIQLITSAAHIWFFKGQPSYFSLFLNLSKKKIEHLIYCTQNISRTIFPKEEPKKSLWQNGGLRDSALYFGIPLISKMSSWPPEGRHWFCFLYFIIRPPKRGDRLNKWYPGPPGLVNFWGFQSRLFCYTGIQLIRTWLTQLIQCQCYDGRLLEIQIRLDLLQLEQNEPLSDNDFVKKVQLFRRFKYLRSFRHTQINPASMVLSVLPVLPPDLRPILELDNNQIAISDFNKLYQTILFRNRRLSYLTMDPNLNFHCLNSEALQYGQRLLQESVDDLIENGSSRQGVPASLGQSGPLREQSPPQGTLRDSFSIDNGFVQAKAEDKVVQLPNSKNSKAQSQGSLPSAKRGQSALLKAEGAGRLRSSRGRVAAAPSAGIRKEPSSPTGWSSTGSPAAASGRGKEDAENKNHKSLSDLFKGKKGRFRQNLLGKRVDYSGRSVIVVGPQLKIYECGLPKQIAYELFQPFVLRILMLQNKAKTVLGAKKLYKQKASYIWNLIQEIVQSHPILLNRAPTLHKLSIQAFQPRLISGKAILLHPLVCSAFNADFDGDQMGIHLPLCFEARAEAWKIAWSQNSLFSVATSSPVCLPSQDMILGSSFLTIGHSQQYFMKVFKKFPLLKNQISIWGTYNSDFHGFETNKKVQKLIEIRVNITGNFQKFRLQFYQQYHSSGAELLRKIRSTYNQIQFYQSI
uniref:RNA polymerase beta' subunit n=1 Tax=Halimeda opuntia TaxID=118223 RepID=UPI0021143E5C|nr:RNA polymerase beta' subunit [Halimeda opuntia]UTN43208.1 RNA polymerase beta' subunit [Halimeda opuntia]